MVRRQEYRHPQWRLSTSADRFRARQRREDAILLSVQALETPLSGIVIAIASSRRGLPQFSDQVGMGPARSARVGTGVKPHRGFGVGVT